MSDMQNVDRSKFYEVRTGQYKGLRGHLVPPKDVRGREGFVYVESIKDGLVYEVRETNIKELNRRKE